MSAKKKSGVLERILMIGLDTTAIIDFFKGDEKLKKYLVKNKEPFATTTINFLELCFGIDPANSKHNEELASYEEFFSTTVHISLDENACKRASRIFWRLKKEGNTINKADCTIAACFLEKGVKKVLTRNKKHFEKIKELETITY